MKFFKPEEYQPFIDKLYPVLSSLISEHLPNVRIEHIGSSAIPGVVSKGDLDIFVGIESKDFENCIEVLKSLDFSIKEDTLRTPSLCMLVTKIYNLDVAIQLVENGSKFEDFIRFRDLVRKSPELISQYNALKMNAIGLAEEEYRLVKSKFIEQVLNS